MKVEWQGARPWRNEPCGHGPSLVGAAGCVFFSLIHLVRTLTDAKELDPLDALARLRRVAGAFVDASGSKPGDLLDFAVAAPIFGLAAGAVVAGKPGSPALRAALVAALRDGGAAVRVSVDGDDVGDHTIAATSRTGSTIVCADSALAGWVELELPQLEALDVFWGARHRPYRVTAVRQISAAVA